MPGPQIRVPGTPKGKKAAGGDLKARYNASGNDMRKWTSIAATQVPSHQKQHKQGVQMEIRAYFERPMEHHKRHNKGLRATAPVDHIQKPDADNIAKFVGDCLSGLAFHDDAQIHNLTVKKLWSESARVEVDLFYGERNTKHK